MSNPFRYFKTSPEIIRLAVMLYVRFPLSLRNVEDLLHERGIEVRANSTQVEPLSSYPARRLHRLAGREPRGGITDKSGLAPESWGDARRTRTPSGPLEFSPSPARRRLPVDPLRAAHRRLVSIKIQVAERLYLGGTCSSDPPP